MDMMVNFILGSMMLAGISGVTIGLGGDEERMCGVVAGVVAFIAGAVTPVFEFVLAAGAVLWLVSFGLTVLFQSDGAVKSTGRVGVGVPGASYPLGGFKKPTIKNMVKM